MVSQHSSQTIFIMLLFALAASLGFFDVVLARRQRALVAPSSSASVAPSPVETTPIVTPLAPSLPTMRLFFAGDVMLSRYVDTVIQRADDPSFPWRLVQATTSAADLFFVNLEAPFSEQGPYDDENMIFAVRPEYVAGLVGAGVDVVSLANNHTSDAGKDGLATTKRVLTGHGIAYALPGEPAVVERSGRSIGIVAGAYNLGLNKETIAADITNVRGRGATFIVASMHAGVEYASTPSAAQMTFARAAIDAGADLVVGHHPHVTQTTEEYRGKLIVYSLGNFIFDQFWSEETMRGQVLQLFLDPVGNPSPTLLSVPINRQGQPSFLCEGSGVCSQ